ncbi:MAG TPA: hypothetical protein PLS53_16875 [Thermoanaerobaculaceae bacterium]|nr:hypothetical protein [Thermoanaerobaculaceae bacterium]
MSPIPRRPRYVSRAAVAAMVWAVSAPASAVPCDVAAEILATERSLVQHEPGPAVIRAEAALERCPGHPALVRLLARAQAAAGNSGTAREVLRTYLDGHPTDCETRSQLAWAELAANNPAEAWQALLGGGCPSTPEESSRWVLLEVAARRFVGDDGPADLALGRLSDRSAMWPEDDHARAHLERQRDPSWTWPWQSSVELGLGGTTDAFAGSPTDVAHTGVRSALGRLTATTTIRAPRTGWLVPLVEASVRGHGIQADEARELSTLELGGRVGAELRVGRMLVIMAARREVLHLDQASSRFSDAWRGEIEAQTPRGLVLFAGGGHRDFRDPWRTRQEWDGGLAGALRLGGQAFTLALTGRRHDATRAVYDLRGASATVVTRVPLGAGWLARASVQGSWDDYPHSRSWEALVAFGNDRGRRDIAARLSMGAWRRLLPGLFGGLTYEYGRRWSSIEKGYQGSFSFREQRVLASLRLDLSGNPWRRGGATAEHVPIDWGFGVDAAPLGGESIRDLVRQDEELRADCGCSAH